MLKVGFTSVAEALLKMKNICNRKFACPSFCWAYFLVVIIVGRREEDSLQIMWWVGNAGVSSIWKHFILTNWWTCDSLFGIRFIEWAFKSIILHNMCPFLRNCAFGFLWVGVCFLCDLSLLDSRFLIFDPYHLLFSRTRYRYTNIQTTILGGMISYTKHYLL